jgi:hypothetical protein
VKINVWLLGQNLLSIELARSAPPPALATDNETVTDRRTPPSVGFAPTTVRPRRPVNPT